MRMPRLILVLPLIGIFLVSCTGAERMRSLADSEPIAKSSSTIPSSTSKREEFTVSNVPGIRSAEILFVVDNSISMLDEIDAVKTRIEEFFGFLTGQSVNFSLRITTTDPNFSGQFITTNSGVSLVKSTDAEAANTVKEMLGLIKQGSSNEMGIKNAKAAAEKMDVLSVLSIIVFSDEQDVSPEPVSAYVNDFNTLQTEKNIKYAFFPFIKTAQSSCSLGSYESYGTRYLELANAFAQNGSRTYDLCQVESTFPEVAFQISRLSACFTLATSATKILNVTLNGNALASSMHSLKPDKLTLCLSGDLDLGDGSHVVVDYEIPAQ